MKCFPFIIVAMMMILCSTSTSSQTALNKGRAPKFSSVYTDMQRDCKSAFTKEEEKEAEGMGQDIPLRCKGYSGYHIILSFAAVTQDIRIAPDYCGDVCEDEDEVHFIPRDLSFYNTSTAKKVEWRLADEKPFAVIVRYSTYVSPDNFESGYYPLQEKYKVGEWLLVRGLKGYERIDFDVDAKKPDANKKARELADNAFMKGHSYN